MAQWLRSLLRSLAEARACFGLCHWLRDTEVFKLRSRNLVAAFRLGTLDANRWKYGESDSGQVRSLVDCSASSLAFARIASRVMALPASGGVC